MQIKQLFHKIPIVFLENFTKFHIKSGKISQNSRKNKKIPIMHYYSHRMRTTNVLFFRIFYPTQTQPTCIN